MSQQSNQNADPSTNQSQAEARSKGKKALWVLFFMSMAFGLPYLAVYFFINSDEMRSSLGQSNNGQIISPARALDGGPYKLADGTQLNIADYAGEWLIITAGQSSCVGQCRDNVISMRQLRRGLGVNRRYVHRVFLSLDGKPFSATVEGDAEYFSGMKNIVETPEKLKGLLEKLSVEQGETENAVYLVDFRGNIMMYYPPGTEAKPILRDIERLFKVFSPK
ncbi:MAG: hypothetical protein JKX83_10605 [Pseudomonadales bacterium]|nr:hypothetical protein [Pseudomonadales bacterium]